MPTDPFEGNELQKHKADLDLSWDSYHHTLGEGPTQAAAGNHKHPITELTIPDDGDGGGTSIAGVVMEYSSGTTTEGELGYLGDVTITSSHDPDWVRLICGPDDASDPLWSNGYITPSKDGVAHFAGYLNIYGNSGLPENSYLRIRMTREPTAEFPYQDHTGYQDVEIKEFMNILVPWMWMIQVEEGRKYSFWVRLRRENSTADSGTVTIGSRQFKMHNFVFSNLAPPPTPPVAKSLQDLILSYNPWAYYPLTVLGSPTSLIDDISVNNRNGTLGGDTYGIRQFTSDWGQPNPELSVFNSGRDGSDGFFSVSSPFNFDTNPGYTFLLWCNWNGFAENFYMSPFFTFNNGVTNSLFIRPFIQMSTPEPAMTYLWAVYHDNNLVARAGSILGTEQNVMKFLAVTYDKASSTLKIYSQGEPVVTVTSVAAPTGIASSNIMCFSQLGNGNYNQHLAIYPRALTAEQINNIWRTGDAMPLP